MKESNPVNPDIAAVKAIVDKAIAETGYTKKSEHTPIVDFSNTEIAFANKSNAELRQMAWLFKMMNKSWLVNKLSPIGAFAVKYRLPFAKWITKKTIFPQFVGGTTLLESQPSIDKLYEKGVLSVLDYGAEAKYEEKDFNYTMNEIIRSIEFAETNASVPVVVAKVSGLGRFDLLESLQNQVPLTPETRVEYKSILKRMDSICHVASAKGVGVFFDAEESWIQDTIDHLVTVMMRRYNREKVVAYNTFQMYRHDRLKFFLDSYDKAKAGGYMLGAKLVRGAYMDKERARAKEMGYESPIQINKQATDDAYNQAIRFCVEHYEDLASCNASHNAKSALLQAELIHEKSIQKDHPHLNFCQLYGMSDHLTFNLAEAGYNVAKYLVYGSVEDVVPYLVRRAKENASVTGDMGRELELITREMKRRKLV